MQQHGSKYFVRRSLTTTPPPLTPTLGLGSKGQNSTYSEHGHFAYQIRESRMHQNGSKYFARRPRDGVKRSKFNFQNMVMLHIKGNHKCSNMVAIILATDPLGSTLGMRSIGQNSNFQIMVMLHIQIHGIWKCSQILANILPAFPLTLGSKGQNSTFSEHGHVAYQIYWNFKI